MLHSNWEQFSFQPVLHRACATQSHSFHPLTIHSSIRLQTYSHSTDHLLIPQAHAVIPLHMECVLPKLHSQKCTESVYSLTYSIVIKLFLSLGGSCCCCSSCFWWWWWWRWSPLVPPKTAGTAAATLTLLRVMDGGLKSTKLFGTLDAACLFVWLLYLYVGHFCPRVFNGAVLRIQKSISPAVPFAQSFFLSFMVLYSHRNHMAY